VLTDGPWTTLSTIVRFKPWPPRYYIRRVVCVQSEGLEVSSKSEIRFNLEEYPEYTCGNGYIHLASKFRISRKSVNLKVAVIDKDPFGSNLCRFCHY